jgi:hypothetical protein
MIRTAHLITGTSSPNHRVELALERFGREDDPASPGESTRDRGITGARETLG